jgi:hypothetical protein
MGAFKGYVISAVGGFFILRAREKLVEDLSSFWHIGNAAGSNLIQGEILNLSPPNLNLPIKGMQ